MTHNTLAAVLVGIFLVLAYPVYTMNRDLKALVEQTHRVNVEAEQTATLAHEIASEYRAK